MTVLRVAILIVVSSNFSPVLLANQSSLAGSDPQAVALIQKSLTALTGGSPVTDVTLTGTAHRIAGSDDETGTATLDATSTGDSRIELGFSSGTRTVIRNHSAIPLTSSFPQGVAASVGQISQPVGEWIGANSSKHPIARHNLMTDSAWFFPALTLSRLAASQSYVLSYVGQETHNGQAVLHITASEQIPQLQANGLGPGVSSALNESQISALVRRLSQMDFYLDPKSLLPVALDFDEHPDTDANVNIITEIRFSDYQLVSGVLVPMHVQKYVNYGLVLDLRFSKAQINSGVSASDFAIQ
jgi:hypothetical protein